MKPRSSNSSPIYLVTIRAFAPPPLSTCVRLYTDPLVEVIPQTQDLFDRALDLYERRPDKTYSMVDVIGMVICADRGITDVLTADHDFEQEGLTILLK